MKGNKAGPPPVQPATKTLPEESADAPNPCVAKLGPNNCVQSRVPLESYFAKKASVLPVFAAGYVRVTGDERIPKIVDGHSVAILVAVGP